MIQMEKTVFHNQVQIAGEEIPSVEIAGEKESMVGTGR